MADFKIGTIISEPSDVRYEFPQSEKISIQRSSLQIQLEKFKKAVIDSFSFDSIISLLVTLAAVWVPVFTSTFRKIFTASSDIVLGVYVSLAMAISFYSVYKNLIAPSLSYLKNRKNKISSDAEIMSKYILEQCNKKK
jgi:hypothetical protein